MLRDAELMGAENDGMLVGRVPRLCETAIDGGPRATLVVAFEILDVLHQKVLGLLVLQDPSTVAKEGAAGVLESALLS